MLLRLRLQLAFTALFAGAVMSMAAANAPAVNRIAGVPMRLPHQSPAIFNIVLANHEVHSGQVVRAAVITSSNVASVEARLRGFGVPLRHVGIGRFALSYQVPWLPPMFKGNWPIRLIARNVDGVQAQKMLYVKYR